MLLRLLPLFSFLFLPQVSLAQQVRNPKPDIAPESCPVTKPYQTSLFVPPSPYEAKADAGHFWFGSDRLWTMLQSDGTWSGLPHYTPNDLTFRQKLLFYRQGNFPRTEPRPKLIVTGRRLDSPAPPLLSDRTTTGLNGDQQSMVVGINLPTLGCWEITGQYESDELTFVVWVAESTSQREPWTETRRKYLLPRAEHGDAGAQFWLGAGYEQGWSGRADFQEALKWFRRAAAQGNADAQNNLGQMYEDGEGVQKDYVQAAQWYRKAAEHVPDRGGAGQGRNNLGLLYMEGLGVPKDYVEAYMWFSLTNPNPNPSLSHAKDQMTPAQVFEAERMAEEWKSNHPEP
jgi:hypothetical protein